MSKLLNHCSFEVSPVATELSGTIQAGVYEVGGAEPTNIIQIDQPWYVDVEWTLKGHLRRHLCGKWCVKVHLESIGKGNEYSLPDPCVYLDMDPCDHDGIYRYRINVDAGTIKPEDCGTVYLVAVTLTSLDACGKPGHIAAYCRGGSLMFYKDSDNN